MSFSSWFLLLSLRKFQQSPQALIEDPLAYLLYSVRVQEPRLQGEDRGQEAHLGRPVSKESPLREALWTLPPDPLPAAPPTTPESPLRPPLGAQSFFTLAAHLQRDIASYLPGSLGPCCPKATRALPSRPPSGRFNMCFPAPTVGQALGLHRERCAQKDFTRCRPGQAFLRKCC